MKSEGRRTKDGGMQNDEARRICHKMSQRSQRGIRISSFGLLSEFVIRVSEFYFLCLTCAFVGLLHGAAPTTFAGPLPPAITLEDFKLTGDLSGDQATFTLTATARVEESKGGSLELLWG